MTYDFSLISCCYFSQTATIIGLGVIYSRGCQFKIYSSRVRASSRGAQFEDLRYPNRLLPLTLY